MLSKSKKWMLGIVIVLVALWGGYHLYEYIRYAPKANPHPKYFVTISGNIEPHMPYPETLMFRATYGTYNPKCDVWISFIEGVRGSRGHPVYYPVHPNAKGDYQVKIPIDAYKPGRCDWKMAWVMDAMTPSLPPKRNWDSAFSFGDVIDFGTVKDGSPGYPLENSATIYCGKGSTLTNCSGTELGSGYSKFDVLRNKSYHFIQNIKNRRVKK